MDATDKLVKEAYAYKKHKQAMKRYNSTPKALELNKLRTCQYRQIKDQKWDKIEADLIERGLIPPRPTNTLRRRRKLVEQVLQDMGYKNTDEAIDGYFSV